MAEQEVLIPEGVDAVVTDQAGMIDTVKNKFDVETIVNRVKSSQDRLFEVGLYAGIGFLSGFLLKKYSTYVAVFVLFLIGLGVLSQLEVINIVVNWDKVYELFGIQAAQTVTADNILSLVWEWVRVNMVISVSYIVGLFIGLKVG